VVEVASYQFEVHDFLVLRACGNQLSPSMQAYSTLIGGVRPCQERLSDVRLCQTICPDAISQVVELHPKLWVAENAGSFG
jgi:hypothetical protein